MDISLSMEQSDAVELCVGTDPIVGITGRAGTGKTTILRHVYAELLKQGTSMALAAPTGRAAKRIYEATGIRATTIHKLLEFPLPDDKSYKIVGNPSTYTNRPRRNENYPLEQSVILLDECSMIGPILYNQLRIALKRTTRLRMFGDNKQLPPVEEGDPPFRSILKNHPSVELSHNYRSDDDIIGNAELILKGRVPQRNARFEIFYTEDPIEEALRLVDEPFTKGNNQVICAMRKGIFGTQRLNPGLQIKFNGSVYTPSLQLNRLNEDEPPITVKAKDKFLWTKNDYTFALFNGDIGEIEHLDSESGELILNLSDREPLLLPPTARGRGSYGNYNYDPRKQLELGYAVTTHKAQGSEFDHVVYVMCSKGRGGAYMCTRNNFYTAITRARTSVVLITDRNAMHLSLRKVI